MGVSRIKPPGSPARRGPAGSPWHCSDFELVADCIPHIVWLAAPDGSIEYVNQRGAEYTGLPGKAPQSWKWMDQLHPEDVGRTARACQDAVLRQVPYAVDYRLRRWDGEFRWHQSRALPARDADGEIVNWVGTVTDIDDQRRLQDSLQAANRQTAESLWLLETLQSTAPVGLAFVDRDFRQVRTNQALAGSSGVPIEQQPGLSIDEVMPELWPELEPVSEQVLETGEAVINRETSGDLRGDPGHVHTWLTSLYPVRLEGEIIGIGIVLVDITERKAMELQLKDQAEHDPLTGVYNRRQLLVELERVLRYADRFEHPGAVLMLDIDNFKWTNDSYGHRAGDRLLITVAEVLGGRLRQVDIVARTGGDEFAIVLPEISEEQALAVALELRGLLGERPTGPHAHVSIGIALFGAGDTMTVDDLLVAADRAMYQVKEAGGDQVAVYKGRSGPLMSGLRALQGALAEQRFVLHAQPIVDLRTNQLACHELLIRMLSQAGETIPPADFLPLAERFSLAGEIDRWVINEAIIVARDQPVTVNLSARSVGDPRILTAVRDSIAAGVDPRHLVFEITETALMTDFKRALAFVSALRELGCELALDDFGTGFGSFTYLKHLPARYLKIAMEFVRDINTDATDKEIVRSIVGIAHTLGKETIAEGVESAEVLETLRGLGVDYAQGFHLGLPAPIAS